MVVGSRIIRVAKNLQIASRRMPNLWDGRASILEMKDAGYAHWKQMEWMGILLPVSV